mmetsp:Transcript_6332/g.14006  ORF Transcript_6332/g.14006 Transcript_6332/m.14006 type:complete len:211 (+) Transcript_6332:135-767(+)
MGPLTMSPIAKMLGTLVRKWSSTLTNLPSISTPTDSSPRLSMNWRRPTQTRTTSASEVFASPPFAASVATSSLSPTFLTPVTLVESWNSIPCFFRIARKFFATSSSMPTPPMLSMNSTTVTWEPRRDQTLPSSRPMTPPPITVSFSGSFSKDSAPVLDTICFSSSSMPGRLITSEPVASMMFFVAISCSPPSRSPTLTEFGPVKVPWPFT